MSQPPTLLPETASPSGRTPDLTNDRRITVTVRVLNGNHDQHEIDRTKLYATQALDELHRIIQLVGDGSSDLGGHDLLDGLLGIAEVLGKLQEMKLPIKHTDKSKDHIETLSRWLTDLTGTRLPRDKLVPESAREFYSRWADIGSRAKKLRSRRGIVRFLTNSRDGEILASLVEDINATILEFLSIVLAEEDITDHAQAHTPAFDVGHIGAPTLHAGRQPGSELSQVTETPSSSLEAYVNSPTQEPYSGTSQERNVSLSSSEAERYTDNPTGSSLYDCSYSSHDTPSHDTPSHDTPSTTDEDKAPRLRWFDVIVIVVTCLGIWKFLAAHLGQSFVPNMLDLVVGTIWTIIGTVLSANSESTALVILFKKGPRDVIRPLFVRESDTRNARNMDASSDNHSLVDVERGMRAAVGTPPTLS